MAFKLRPIQESDLETVFDWRNSERIRKISYHDHVISWEEHTRWFKRLENNEERKTFVFEESGRSLGIVNFTDIDKKNHRCRWGFYLGDEDIKKGVGTEMGCLALDYVFNTLGLEKVCAETFDWNEVSIAFHVKLGFHREGVLRKQQMKDGELQDLIIYGLLKDDWVKRRKELGRSGY